MRLVPVMLLFGTVAIAPGALAQNAVDPSWSAATFGPASGADLLPAQPQALDEIEALQRKAFEKYGPLGIVTLGMDRPEIVVLCHTIAQTFATIAAEETDRDRRIAKFAEVWRFEQRIAEPLEQARKSLGESGYNRALSKSSESMNLLSMMPDPQLEQGVQAGDELMFVWATTLAARCGQMLDEMGIAKVGGDPPIEYIAAKTRFRYRGADFAEIFADTELGRYADEMCRGGAAPDFSGAPLGQRGYEGMSLLDWAIECDDRASFDALVAAGFDLDAKGLWEDPPLVRTASEKRLWFLRRLLDEGVSPDSMGRTKTALLTASDDLDAINSGGDTKAAFNLLRERGASLNFPNFQDSIWYRWSLHETRWDLILEHWSEFESDPVELASMLEYYLSGDMNWAKKETGGAALEVKALLVDEYGVCFPVGKTFQMKNDERGFRIQPDCPKGN